MSSLYLRNPSVSVVSDAREILIFSPNGPLEPIRQDIEMLYAIIVLLREPRTAEEVASHLQIPEHRVAPLLQNLVEHKIALTGSREMLQAAMPMVTPAGGFCCSRLVMGISGTIEAANTLGLAAQLKRVFARQVDVILTDDAAKFLKPEVATYFGLDVWTSAFVSRAGANVPHIALASAAELVLILPASAHTIHRLATGACSDLLSLVVAATRAPVVVAPTMNAAMFRHAAIQRNINRLREDGVHIIEPGLGLEVSDAAENRYQFCGVGVIGHNLVSMLTAVLRGNGQITH